jgi:bacillithiol synthase
MVKHAIPYRATGKMAPIVCDYIEGSPHLREFYEWEPNVQGIERAMAARSFGPADRAALCAAIEVGYVDCEMHAAVRNNLDLLRKHGTLTVTTGHQLCLFTGPLYVPFKLLNVIRLARSASTAEHPVVPIFWMASEDHDRAEIDHAWIGGKKVSWPGEVGGAVGRMHLTGIEEVLREVDPLLGSGPYADEMRELLRACYRTDHTLAQATRLFVNALFGRFGLLVLDGDDPSLKRAFAPVMQEELLNEVTVRTVRYANERLGAHYPAQAHAREINLFHLRPGHRSRIERDGDLYRVLDGGPVLTLDQVLAELDSHPEHFSPNVLLRPLYQETILPNIAYVGGGGELAYWLQLRWLFMGLRLPMPALMLRTSAAFITAKRWGQWSRSGLDVTDLFAEQNDLQKRIAQEKAGFNTRLDQERAAQAAFYTALAARAKGIDATLEASVRAKEAFAAKGLKHIEARFMRAAKRASADALRQASDVVDGLFPGGVLQERRDNFLPFYAAEGPAFFDQLLAMLDPLDARFSVLRTTS